MRRCSQSEFTELKEERIITSINLLFSKIAEKSKSTEESIRYIRNQAKRNEYLHKLEIKKNFTKEARNSLDEIEKKKTEHCNPNSRSNIKNQLLLIQKKLQPIETNLDDIKDNAARMRNDEIFMVAIKTGSTFCLSLGAMLGLVVAVPAIPLTFTSQISMALLIYPPPFAAAALMAWFADLYEPEPAEEQVTLSASSHTLYEERYQNTSRASSPENYQTFNAHN